jgi:hypothetical protein
MSGPGRSLSRLRSGKAKKSDREKNVKGGMRRHPPRAVLPRSSGADASRSALVGLVDRCMWRVSLRMVEAVSLSGDADGPCEGARPAGCEVPCGVEHDVQASRTYAANFLELPLLRCGVGRFLVVKQLDVPDTDELFSMGAEVVCGVLQCQGFQSFHDGFVFHGREPRQVMQVGNAVPPIFGLVTAQTPARVLAGVRKKPVQ